MRDGHARWANSVRAKERNSANLFQIVRVTSHAVAHCAAQSEAAVERVRHRECSCSWSIRNVFQRACAEFRVFASRTDIKIAGTCCCDTPVSRASDNVQHRQVFVKYSECVTGAKKETMKRPANNLDCPFLTRYCLTCRSMRCL